MRPEFDAYAKDYQHLLHDPLRERFAGDPGFFAERKWRLLERFLSRQGVALAATAWLDVGCGTGTLLRLGQGRLGRTAGCDFSAEMLRQCQGLEVKQQDDPERLPYADGSFSLVTAVCVFHHVEAEARPRLAVELRRVLRPGGIACMVEHNPINPAVRVIVGRSPVDRNARLLGAGRARRILRAAGFSIVSTDFFLYLPEKLYRRLGGLEDWLGWLPLGGQYAVFARKAAG